MHAPSLTLMPDLSRPAAELITSMDPWDHWAGAQAISLWAELADAATTPNPFFEHWYLLPALEAFDADRAARILAIRTGGRLIGLMPLVMQRSYQRWPLRHLASWQHANAFLGTPLVRAGCETLFWQGLLDWADKAAPDDGALFLHLPAMPLEQPLTQCLMDLCFENGRPAGLVMREQRALLHSPLSPEAYLERALRGKKRKELRRQHARLAEQGALAFERREDAQGIDAWIETFLALEAAGWKGRSASAMASAPETASLFRQALIQAAALGKLERLSLTLDGRPVAMLANFITPPGSFSYKTAFDETLARFSPGVLLQLENLALLRRDDVTWCDSCAAPDHPMIDSIWTERRPIGRLSVGIGGKIRRAIFKTTLALELQRNPTGIGA